MKLTDNIHLLKIDFEIPLKSKKKIRRYVNAILVFSDKITLIDTGVKGSEKFIFEYIKSQNRDYTEIDRIILSHSHPDHIGGARIIKDLTNCRIYADKSERNWIEDIETQYTERPVPGFYTLADRPVRIDDFLVDNSYAYKNDKGESISDHHKSYGYLRCPEVSTSILAFLQD